MTIYASDLDQTLIYSRKSFGVLAEPEPPVRNVEMLNGEEISFMTETAISMLRDIASQLEFVPVTTRTIEQYSRISIFQTAIKPKYAISSNGGNILMNGVASVDWNASVRKRMSEQCMPHQEVWEAFHKFASDAWLLNGKMADELFYYFIVERDRVPLDELSDFGKWLQGQRWSLSLQGRKVYVVPDVVSKRTAVEQVMQMEGSSKLIASGDSLLDLPLLHAAQQPIAPAHGEIYRQFLARNDTLSLDAIHFVDVPGLMASEAILEQVAHAIEIMSKPGV